MKNITAYNQDLPFVEALKQGLTDYKNINDYIKKWHEGPYTCSISEFLGMTKQQYLDWLRGQTAYLRRTFPKGRKDTAKPQQNTNKTNNRKTAAQ